MKKLKTLFAAALSLSLAFTLAACTQNGDKTGNSSATTPNEPLKGESRILVVYFSWSSSHNTQTMAEYVANATGGELFRIIPKTPYSTVYNEVTAQAQKEKSENARPQLSEDLTTEQFASYDVIFVGYPIWWYDAPMIIYTFLESHDFTEKTIIPFATSGGSGINEESKFKNATGAEVKKGLCISGFSAGSNAEARVQNYIKELGYNK